MNYASAGRLLRVTSLLGFGLLVAPQLTRADLIYTFVTDSSPGDDILSGRIDVKDSVLASGQITFDDIVSYQFVVLHDNGFDEFFDYTNSYPLIPAPPFFPPPNPPYPPITVDPTTGGFTGIGSQFDFEGENQQNFHIYATANYGSANSQPFGGEIGGGHGHWTVEGSVAVPAPASILLASVGGIGTLLMTAARRRSLRPASGGRN